MMNTPPVPTQDLPRLAGYRLEREVGRGRRSIVYLARQLPRSRRVALKVARNAGDRTFAAAAAFQTEFDTQATLADPHVLRVFECGRANGREYMAMEYAAGGSMAARAGPVGGAMALAVAIQAARALRHLHQHGWVHRDVKPANLLVRQDGSVALADFGSARRTGEALALPEGTVTGTPRYAAPEQSWGDAPHPTADVYSLGACLYQMLTGEPPFSGETLAELLGQHLFAPVPTLPPGHAVWQPLLDAMLAKDSHGRPADGAAVLLQLQRMEHSH
jgi:serine/threonine protein kinase